jgi:hypothetical protein
MGGSGSALFADADAFQAHLPVTTQLLVTRAGSFRARLTWMELTDLHLLLARETMPRIAYVSLPTERVFIVFPTHRTSALICDGVAVRRGDITTRLAEGLWQNVGRTGCGATAIWPNFAPAVRRS